MSSGDRFKALHPHARPHHRPGFRAVSSSDNANLDVNALSNTRVRPSVLPHPRHGSSLIHSTSSRHLERISLARSHRDSKIWRNRRGIGADGGADASSSLYARIFKVVFVLCLILFLRALSGAGMRVPLEQDGGGAVKNEEHVQHDHLAIDPDGLYSSTSAGNDARQVIRYGWGKRSLEYTIPARDKEYPNPKPDMDENILHSPESTVDVVEDVSSALQTPPPVPSIFTPRNSEAAFRNYLATRIENGGADILPYNHDEASHDEADEDFALRIFSPDDPVPVYPLRIHLPPLPDARNRLGQGTRAGWGRKHGKVLF